MRNATHVLPFKMRRPTRRHYFLRVNFRPFSFFTRTMRAKINPGDYALYKSTFTLHYILHSKKVKDTPQNWLNIAVDAITSSDQTGKKIYYQSGAHWYPNPNRNPKSLTLNKNTDRHTGCTQCTAVLTRIISRDNYGQFMCPSRTGPVFRLDAYLWICTIYRQLLIAAKIYSSSGTSVNWFFALNFLFPVRNVSFLSWRIGWQFCWRKLTKRQNPQTPTQRETPPLLTVTNVQTTA